VSTGGEAVRPPEPAAPKVSIRTILSERAVRVVILVIFVVMLGFGIVAPILPLYARSFGVGYEAAGLLISAFAMTRLAFDLVAGPLIDRFGERLCASVGLFFVGVSSLLTALAPTFSLAVIFRGAGGAGSAVLFASLYSYLLKVVPRDRMARTLSLFYGAFNVGVIAGAPLGGLIAGLFNLAAPLHVYAGILLVSGLMYLRMVPDPPLPSDASGRSEADAGAPGILGLLRNGTFVTVIFLNFSYLWFVAAVLDTLVPLFGQEGLGMSTVAVGVAFAVIVTTEFAVLYHAGSVSDRRGRKAVLIPSTVALAGLIAVTGLSPNPTILFVLLGLMGVASGYAGVPPGAMLSDVTPGRGSGSAVGAFRFAGDLGFVLGPLVAGAGVNALGFEGAFAVVAIPVMVGLLFLLRTPETLGRETAPVG
jgi:DHA1 family multidrug resistance protein-like MFS transporter